VVTKRGLNASNYAIAFTGNEEPEPKDGEEQSMLPAIRIKTSKKNGKLDVMSRTDFGRLYTFEYNLESSDVGKVHDQYLGRLNENYRHVMNRLTNGNFSEKQQLPNIQFQSPDPIEELEKRKFEDGADNDDSS
jgi:hypothetical protein